MSIRQALAVLGAAVLSCTVTWAQSSQTPTQSTAQSGDADRTPITLVGCIQREADYRREHDLGRGGVAATGAGRGNEYVLINASTVGSAGASSADCARVGAGDAYELTGNRERDLEPFVGRTIQISGMLKKADTAPTASGAKPTGGVDPLGQDLRLFEVNVTSFSDVAAAPRAEAASPAPAPPQVVASARVDRAPAPVRQVQLPRTASPLAMTGLLGLLSLCGALSLRAYRR